MGKLRKNKQGFSTIEAVLILVIVGILGFTGWYVWHAKNNADKSLNSNHSTRPAIKKKSTTKTTTPSAETTPFVSVIQDDGIIIQVTPDKIAKTADETAILTALHSTCASTDTYVTVNHVVFDGMPNFVQSGNYVEINATACAPFAKTVDELGGSGSANYLHKNSSSTWILDTSSQMAPSCAEIDGLGYPTSIIGTCYDGSTARAPR